jgi:hypothetical protein
VPPGTEAGAEAAELKPTMPAARASVTPRRRIVALILRVIVGSSS